MSYHAKVFIGVFLASFAVLGLAPDVYSLCVDGGRMLAERIRRGPRRPDTPVRVLDSRCHPDTWGRWS